MAAMPKVRTAKLANPRRVLDTPFAGDTYHTAQPLLGPGLDHDVLCDGKRVGGLPIGSPPLLFGHWVGQQAPRLVDC